MRAHVVWIGMIDIAGSAHMVPFEQGLNIVTGRSSTGKSALIEVFDYCFGSSDYTVPAGVITENAKLFFVVLKLKRSLLVLARRPSSDHCFVHEEFDLSFIRRTDWMAMPYFPEQSFRPVEEYKKRLRTYFGVTVTDVDEDLDAREWRGRKLATPSVRSFTSFMLQHQNLVANKHAIFYRFDEKNKREQAIDHLKIFLGFADPEYFVLKQKENELEHRLRQLQRALPRIAERRKRFGERLSLARKWLEGVSGKPFEFNQELALDDPTSTLDIVRQGRIAFSADSDVHVRQLHEAQIEKANATASLREIQVLQAEVVSSKAYAQKYVQFQRATQVPHHAHLQSRECPFCHVGDLSVEPAANSLAAAVDWLNTELSRTGQRNFALDEQEASVAKQVEAARQKIRVIDSKISGLQKQVTDLKNVRSQYERTVEARARLESILEEWADSKSESSDLEIEELSKQLKGTQQILSERYNMQRHLQSAESRINELMELYGPRFDFEKSYKPIHLRLSLETFDLWHDAGRQKVFLRSMGSGANWLASHLVLFLSLQRYFCEVGEACSIPPILFLDQPSQVYFPAMLDGGEAFDANVIAERDATRDTARKVDEDMLAVTNFFDQLVRHCDETERATKIRPQIILTDHADHLKLKNADFESLVRARWRRPEDGFVQLGVPG